MILYSIIQIGAKMKKINRLPPNSNRFIFDLPSGFSKNWGCFDRKLFIVINSSPLNYTDTPMMDGLAHDLGSSAVFILNSNIWVFTQICLSWVNRCAKFVLNSNLTQLLSFYSNLKLECACCNEKERLNSYSTQKWVTNFELSPRADSNMAPWCVTVAVSGDKECLWYLELLPTGKTPSRHTGMRRSDGGTGWGRRPSIRPGPAAIVQRPVVGSKWVFLPYGCWCGGCPPCPHEPGGEADILGLGGPRTKSDSRDPTRWRSPRNTPGLLGLSR